MNDPVWRTALALLINQAEREMCQEVGEARLLTGLASAMFMAVESIRTVEHTKESTKDFVDRAVLIGTEIDSARDLILQASGAMDRKEAVKEGEVSTKQQEVFEGAKNLWEGVFGKRGNPTVEAKVAQTEGILKGRIEEIRKAENAKKQGRPKVKKRRRR